VEFRFRELGLFKNCQVVDGDQVLIAWTRVVVTYVHTLLAGMDGMRDKRGS
jgi:hypothetical protein